MLETEEADTECGNLMCMMECEHGFAKDERGCDICKCKGGCTCDMGVHDVISIITQGMICFQHDIEKGHEVYIYIYFMTFFNIMLKAYHALGDY